MENIQKFTLIINTMSSSYDYNTIALCKSIFESYGCDLEIKEIPSNTQGNFISCLKGLMVDAFLNGRIPISSGGDGTFSAMQQAYVQLYDEGIIDILISEGFINQAEVGHLGMGASNDMNINLGFTQNPATNTELLINGQASMRDIGIVNGVPMGYSAICGLGAHIPYSTPTKLKKEKHVKAYIKYAFLDARLHCKKFFAPLIKPYSVKVTLDDGEPFYEKAHILGPFKGVQFASMQLLASDPLDNGKLNYLSVKDPVDLLFKIAQGLIPGGTIDGVKQASKIDVEFLKHKPDYPLDLDGEVAPFDIEEGIHASVYPRKLIIRTPKKY